MAVPSDGVNTPLPKGADWSFAPAESVKVWIKNLGIVMLPTNYSLMQQQRPTGNRADKYLYGHPSGSRFRSPNEFMPHLEWLKNNQTHPCTCKLCKPEKRSSGAVKRESQNQQPSPPAKRAVRSESPVRFKAVVKSEQVDVVKREGGGADRCSDFVRKLLSSSSTNMRSKPKHDQEKEDRIQEGKEERQHREGREEERKEQRQDEREERRREEAKSRNTKDQDSDQRLHQSSSSSSTRASESSFSRNSSALVNESCCSKPQREENSSRDRASSFRSFYNDPPRRRLSLDLEDLDLEDARLSNQSNTNKNSSFLQSYKFKRADMEPTTNTPSEDTQCAPPPAPYPDWPHLPLIPQIPNLEPYQRKFDLPPCPQPYNTTFRHSFDGCDVFSNTAAGYSAPARATTSSASDENLIPLQELENFATTRILDKMVPLEIKNTTGIHYMLHMTDEDNYDRVLELSGPLDAVCKAISLISRRVANMSRFLTHDKPATLRILFEQELLPKLIGASGKKINWIRDKSNVEITVGTVGALLLSTETVLSLTGVTDSIHIASYFVGIVCHEYMNDVKESEYYYPVPNYVFGEWKNHMMPEGGVLHDAAVTRHHNTGGYETKVSSELVGFVIGKHGIHLNEICQRSGAKISVRDTQQSGANRYATFSVTGAKQSCNLAMFMILESYKRAADAKVERKKEQDAFEKELKNLVNEHGYTEAQLGDFGLQGLVTKKKWELLEKASGKIYKQ
ncbi:UNVERIFIED_CONTAM: hypothetical protein HDU68_006645 [Siphonaria sp. JEL0065]|nr:hypothetical protein HDU68_006645 [Siphonaria sp. JEL0065]